MAYTPHVLCAFGGNWTDDPGEIWECTVRLLANGGGGDTLDPDAYLAAIATPLGTWFAAAGSAMANIAILRWVKANHIGADGKYVDATTTHVHDYAGGVNGGAAPVGPQFVSRAYTWETASARGPAHRGRIYPPNATVVISGGAFIFSAANRDANAANGAALLAVLKNAAGGAGVHATPVVASKIGGAIQAITGVTSDNTFDVQRRRKNRIKPVRSAVVALA